VTSYPTEPRRRGTAGAVDPANPRGASRRPPPVGPSSLWDETGSASISAADLRANYPQFFWKAVNPYIGEALRYLRVTQEGQQWVANLYANVFATEHRGQIS